MSKPYPSDLSDERWALIEPMITAWKQARVGRSATGDPGSCDLREIGFKSSYSAGDGGQCVEVASGLHTVHVRDSKDHARRGLAVGRGAWAVFVGYAVEEIG